MYTLHRGLGIHVKNEIEDNETVHLVFGAELGDHHSLLGCCS